MKIYKIIHRYDELAKLKILEQNGELLKVSMPVGAISSPEDDDVIAAMLDLARDLSEKNKMPEEEMKFEILIWGHGKVKKGKIIHFDIRDTKVFTIKAYTNDLKFLGEKEVPCSGNITI